MKHLTSEAIDAKSVYSLPCSGVLTNFFLDAFMKLRCTKIVEKGEGLGGLGAGIYLVMQKLNYCFVDKY